MTNKKEIIEAIEKYKIIAILRNIDMDKLMPLARALYEGGIRLIEVPFSENDDKETARKIAALAGEFCGKMYVGAGTVLNAEQVERTRLAGGSFIISPNVDREVVEETCRKGLVSMPGVFSPTELIDAMKYGADFTKLFPATLGGREFIKAVLAPVPNAKIIAVGGINCDNFKSFLEAGAVGIGVGTAFTDKKLIEAGDFGAIRENALKYTEQL